MLSKFFLVNVIGFCEKNSVGSLLTVLKAPEDDVCLDDWVARDILSSNDCSPKKGTGLKGSLPGKCCFCFLTGVFPFPGRLSDDFRDKTLSLAEGFKAFRQRQRFVSKVI